MASSVNMLFFGIVCLVACTFCRAADDDKCQSFAGGSVFPQETRRTSGHAIQWSQAVSKFCIQRVSFPVLGLSWNLITVYESQPLCQLLIFMALFLFAKSISFGINTFRRNSCFLCVCLPKIDLHTLTDITILLLMYVCVLWGNANAFLRYIFFKIPTAQLICIPHCNFTKHAHF